MKINKTVKLIGIFALMTLLLCGCGAANSQGNMDNSAVDSQDEVQGQDNQVSDADTTAGNSSESEETDLQETIEITDAMSAYEAFLGFIDAGEVKAVVDEGVTVAYEDFEAAHVGEEYTYDELTDLMFSYKRERDKDVPAMENLYSFIHVGDETFLALQYRNMGIYSAEDDSTSVLILAYKDSALHITYGYSTWCRSETSLCKNGYMSTVGSAGAGDTVYEAVFINEEGKPVEICHGNRLIGTWILSHLGFSSYFDTYEADEFPNVVVSACYFGEEQVCTYEPYEEGAKLSDDDLEFIKAYEEEGIIWVTEEELTERVNKQIELLGAPADIADGEEISWKMIAQTENGMKSAFYIGLDGWTADSNHSKYAGWEISLSDKQSAQLVAAEQARPATMEELNDVKISSSTYPYIDEETDLIYLNSVGTPGQKDFFQIYLTTVGSGVVVTPDGKAVEFNQIPVDFIYGTFPELQAADYDGDGAIELSIWTYIYHGTGFIQHTLFMVDCDSEYEHWNTYHLTPDFYVAELRKHYVAVDEKDAIVVSLDGQEVNRLDKAGDTADYTALGDNRVTIDCGDASKGELNFLVHTTPVFYSENNYIGLAGNTMDMNLSYLGDGDWQVDSIEVGENIYE